MWKRLIELEDGSKNGDRYNNRGGRLLKEEKARNTIKKELPRLEATLKTHIYEVETETGTPFLVNGASYIDTIETQKHMRTRVKNNKMMSRKIMKNEKLEEELAWGHKPTTADPRFAASSTTPRRTPSRLTRSRSGKDKLSTPARTNSSRKRRALKELNGKDYDDSDDDEIIFNKKKCSTTGMSESLQSIHSFTDFAAGLSTPSSKKDRSSNLQPQRSVLEASPV